MSYFKEVAIDQNVKAAPGNCSAVNLAAGATFTGAWESTLNCAGIQVNLTTTQNCTIYVDQSQDGMVVDYTNTYMYYYSIGGIGFTVQATGSFFRIRVTNTGSAVTTTFRLQSVLCPVVEALPQALTQHGFLKVSTQEMSMTPFGTNVKQSPTGALRADGVVRLIGACFSGAVLDGNFWATSGVAGGATATVGSGQLTLATGGIANGAITINSQRVARYLSGSPNYIRAIVRCPAQLGLCVRTWGANDANNGYYFSYDGSTLSVVSRKSTVSTPVNSGSFNGTLGATYTLDANVHTYEIYWTNSKAWFFVDNELLHTINASVTTAVDDTNLKIGMNITNSGGNINNNTLEIRVISINRQGVAQSRPQWRYQSGPVGATVLKYGPGTLHRVTINRKTGTTVTLYDSINTVAPASPICIIDASVNVGQVEFGLDFYTGLIMVTVGAVDTTIIYE
jgi:hypothetical protein